MNGKNITSKTVNKLFDLKKGIKYCSVCSNRPSIWFHKLKTYHDDTDYVGYCSKTCIANRTIKHYNLVNKK